MRILNIHIPENKRLVIGLQSIHGIGPHRSSLICKETKLDESMKVKDLTNDQEVKIQVAIDKLGIPLESDLRREVIQNIKRLQDISSYRGFRHRRRLPVRGQRTKTNARTRRGAKRTMANKKKVTK